VEQHSVGKRIGEFLILGLYLVIDAVHLWPHSHFFALLAAIVGLIALLLLDGGFSKKQIAVLTSTMCAGCIAVYFFAPAEAVPEIEISGTLLPGSEPTPRNSCERSSLPADTLRILIGTNTMALTQSGKITAIQIGSCNVLSMERVANKISVGVDLYDAKGKLIATTRNGEIHAITGENVRIRRDGDLSALIIEDGANNELLYVKYLNRNTVKARGVFGCPGHRLLTVRDNSSIAGGTIRGNCSVDSAVFLQFD
jgi:hypothetical protein